MSATARPSTPPAAELWVCHLGTVPYRRALAVQEHVRELRQRDELPDTLLLLEHPPVYTLGRRAAAGELALGEDACRARGIDVVASDRGGRITYHGPGQLVGYPIVRVPDVLAFVRGMEHAIVLALAEEGVDAHARPQDGPDYTGVWVGPRKIASIGVHVQRGVSTHGFAVNVHNDLAPFTWVVACGLPDVAMTSLLRERPAAADDGCEQALRCFRRRAAYSFARVHGRRQRLVSTRALGIEELVRPQAQTVPEAVPA
jgi:lipoyl(octanoyl) transferase